jgi:tetratricopeptide (TPR) repeat protein
MVNMSRELYDEAVRLEEAGQYEAALVIWRRLAELKPNRGRFLRLGGAAWKLGLVDEGENAFKRALEVDPRSVIALGVLGMLAIQRGDWGAAADYLKRASEIEPDQNEQASVQFSMLGVAQRKVGKTKDAEEAQRTAIQIDPNYEEAHYNLGVVLKLTDRHSEAETHFRKALELDPDFAPAHRELGFVLMERKAGQEAEGHLRKALELTPDDPWAHIYLGACLFRSDPEAAEAEYRIAEKLKPKWSLPLLLLGKVYESKRYEQRDAAIAQSFYERALQLEPDEEEALEGLARLRHED